MIKIYFLFY